MKEAICAKVRLKPGSLEQVRAWAHEINKRRTEALETLVAEGVWIESVFLDSGADGDFLVYYMRTDSLEQAMRAAEKSTAAIDALHNEFKRKTWADVRKLELLLDLERDG